MKQSNLSHLCFIWEHEECPTQVYDSAVEDFTETMPTVWSYTVDSELLQNTSAFRHHDVETFQAALFCGREEGLL